MQTVLHLPRSVARSIVIRMISNLLFILVCGFIILPRPSNAMMRPRSSTSDFFPKAKANLTRITWAHAVNNLAYLTETLNSTSINMIEADIVMGKLNGDGPIIPIMGHPPVVQSDLSLEEFLHTVSVFNHDHRINDTELRKGIKLDFKNIEVFQNSIPIIGDIYDRIDYPIWLNADIIPGPLNATTGPVDADLFLSNAKNFSKSVLSLGWTTNYGNVSQIDHANYTDSQIEQMLDALKRNNISDNYNNNFTLNPVPPTEVTFAVRAGIVAESLSQVRTLKENTAISSTLTVWSSAGDSVDVEKLRKVIFEYGLDRVYVDVPKELLDKLHLDSSASRLLGNKTSWLTIVAAVTALLLASSTKMI